MVFLILKKNIIEYYGRCIIGMIYGIFLLFFLILLRKKTQLYNENQIF